MRSNLKLPESDWLIELLAHKTVSYFDLYWPIWTNRTNLNQPVAIGINRNQSKSTQINPNQPESTQINPNQPESTRINLYQLRIIRVSYLLTYNSHSWSKSIRKYQISTFSCYLVCTPYTQSWVFFQNGQNTAFWLLYYSSSKKPTARVFIWCDKEYPNVHFECKTATERYLVAEFWANQFWVFLEKKIGYWFFSKTPKAVLLITQQPNIAQRLFCIQNERRDIFYHLI